jgi:hypothetical protein
MSHILEWIFGMILAILLPVQLYLGLVGAIVLVDLLLALAANDSGEFKWKKLWDGLLRKVLIYPLIVIILFWIDELIVNPFITEYFKVNHIGTKFGLMVVFGRDMSSIITHYNKIFKTDLKSNAGVLYEKIKSFITDLTGWIRK